MMYGMLGGLRQPSALRQLGACVPPLAWQQILCTNSLLQERQLFALGAEKGSRVGEDVKLWNKCDAYSTYSTTAVFSRKGFASTVTDDGAPLGGGASTLVVRSGKVEPCSLASDEWLASMPRGAYTNARTVGRDAVFELDYHFERLANSVKLMLFAEEVDLSSPDVPAISTAEGIRALLLPELKTALQRHRDDNPQYDGEAKLAFLVTWPPGGGGCDEGSGEGGAAPQAHVHVAPLGPPPARPVKAMLAGTGRENATAKDSAWVAQRMALERGKPSDVNEVLLQNAAGEVLEGASSNFFAVVGGRLQTADEGVLPGSLRRAVLEVCVERGVEVELTAPRAEEAGEWEGALLTSTARLALPLDALLLPGGAGEREFPPDSLAHEVAHWVAEYVKANSQRVLP